MEAIVDVTQPVLRREYLVRVAVLKPARELQGSAALGHWFNGVVPVFGAVHDDKEIIRFNERHIHIDWRFASTKAYATAWKANPFYEEKGTEKGYVVREQDVLRYDEVVLTLRRHAVEYPNRPNSWQPRLEAAFADKTLLPGLVCPHRGAKLSSCQPTDGCVRCPLHGLNWDTATGKMVRLFEPVEA